MDIMTYLLAKKYTDKVVEEAQLGGEVNLDGYFSEANLQALTEEEILEICNSKKEK